MAVHNVAGQPLALRVVHELGRLAQQLGHAARPSPRPRLHAVQARLRAATARRHVGAHADARKTGAARGGIGVAETLVDDRVSDPGRHDRVGESGFSRICATNCSLGEASPCLFDDGIKLTVFERAAEDLLHVFLVLELAARVEQPTVGDGRAVPPASVRQTKRVETLNLGSISLTAQQSGCRRCGGKFPELIEL